MSQPELAVQFEDRYGETRVIHRNKSGWALKRVGDSPVHAINRAVAELLGNRIRVLREKRGMTLAELCVRAGLRSSTPKSRMYEIERGQRKEGMRLGTLYALADALDVPPSDLLPPVDEVLDLAGVEPVAVPGLAVKGG